MCTNRALTDLYAFSARFIQLLNQIINAILDEIIFKLSDNLINQIGNRYANYASRIGIISHE